MVFLGVFLGITLIISFLGINDMTGRTILEDYTNETSCVVAGHIWENLINETCEEIPDCVECVEGCLIEGSICESDCVVEYTEKLCEEGCKETCGENETECFVCEPDCVAEYTEKLCEDNCVLEEDLCGDCQETCKNCSEKIIGGQCIGDICDSNHLDLCLTLEECESVNGYWYNNICNAEEESDDENYNTEENTQDEIEEEFEEEISNETIEIEQNVTNETEEVIEENIYFLTDKEREILISEFGNVSTKITKAELVDGGIEITFELKDYSITHFYDTDFSKKEINSQIEKDRINWLKDIANTLLQKDNIPEEAEEFIGEYPIQIS